MNKLYTAQEVADRLKIKKTTVYELIKRGELESSKIGKQLRVSEEQLTQYLNRSSSGNSESGQDIPYTFVNFEPESSLLKRDYLLHSSCIILGGQTSAALELLLGKMSAHPAGTSLFTIHKNNFRIRQVLHRRNLFRISGLYIEADRVFI